jgi:hypothetical protein
MRRVVVVALALAAAAVATVALAGPPGRDHVRGLIGTAPGGPASGNIDTNGYGICDYAPTTDVAPSDIVIKSEANYARETPHAASNVVIMPGDGRMTITVDTTGVKEVGVTVTQTCHGAALAALTEGVGFACSGLTDAQCATNLAVAISAQVGTCVVATAAAAVVYAQPIDCSGYAVSFASAAGGGGGTAFAVVNGTDGNLIVGSRLTISPALAYWTVDQEVLGRVKFASSVGVGATVKAIGTTLYVQNYGDTGSAPISATSFSTASTGGSLGSTTLLLSSGAEGRISSTTAYNGAADIGYMRKGAGLFGATNGAGAFTGDFYAGNSALTASTMTATSTGVLRETVSRYDWTNAMVVALGASLTGDITVATLPAKTQVEAAYVVIDTQCASTAGLTVAVGRTGAGYIDYIVASNAQVAANTVYGDASAERGTNLTGYDLPSYTATTAVVAHFISTTNNLSAVTACTGHVILVTTVLP